MTKRLFLLSLLLFCLVALPVGTCQAADTIQVQEQLIKQLLANSTRLEEITTILQLNSSEAQRQLLITTAELQASKKELAELKQAHQQLTDSYNKMIALSQKQSDSLNKINKAFEDYSKEVKAKIASLERQKTLLEFAAGAVLIYAVTR